MRHGRHGRTIVAVTTLAAPERSYAAETTAGASALETDLERGLTDAEAAGRLERSGPKRLHPPARPDYPPIASRQLMDPLAFLLVAAAVVSAIIGESVEAVAIGAIVVVNGVRFVQEAPAERPVLAPRESFAMELAGLEPATSWVRSRRSPN